MVLLSHTRNDFFVSYDFLPESEQGFLSMAFYFFCRMGHEAVMLFFVLSGFLVGGKGLENIMNRRFDIPKYTIDRTIRIGLPLIACILFYFVTCLILGQPFNWLCAIGNLFSLQGIFCESLVSPFWSLAYEVWFYILLGIIALFFRPGKPLIKLMLLLVVMMVFTKLNTTYLLLWFMGAFAYLCRPVKSNKLILAISLMGVFFSITLFQLAKESNAMAAYTLSLSKPIIELILGGFTCILVQQLILIEPKTKFAISIENTFHHLAAFSYTLYLSHRITLLLVFKFIFDKDSAGFNSSSLGLYFVLLLICLIVAYLLYLPFERNTYKVKRYVKNRIQLAPKCE